MRWVCLAVLLLAPGRVAAQEVESSDDVHLVLQLDPSSLSDPELEALQLGAEREQNARHAELPSLEVMPYVLIPIGGLTAIGGVVSFTFALEGPIEFAHAGVPLMIGGALLILTGIAWVIERGITTRRHPSWAAYRRALRASHTLRAEQRARERRHRPERHPRRSPWH